MTWKPERKKPPIEEPYLQVTARLFVNGKEYTHRRVEANIQIIEHLLKKATGMDIERFIVEAKRE